MEPLISFVTGILGGFSPTTWLMLLGLLVSISLLRRALT